MNMFGILLAFAGVIVLIIAAAQAVQNHSYKTGSETVMGSVIRKRTRRLKNGTSYELTVSYTVDGNTYERTVGALKTEYQTIQEGDELELRYKLNNPKKAVRPMGLNPQNVRVVLILGAILVVVGIALFLIERM